MTDEESTKILEDILADPQDWLNKYLLIEVDLNNARRYITQQNTYIEYLEQKVLQLKAQLLWWRTRGKEGMAPDVDEKS